MNSVRWLLSVVEVLDNEYWFKTVLRPATRFRPLWAKLGLNFFQKSKFYPFPTGRCANMGRVF
jgi:hypothetical protein